MYTYLTTVMYKEDSNAGAGVQADTTSSLYFTEIPMENNDRFNPMIKLNASNASTFSNVNYALIHWPDEVEPRRYFINYKRVTEENTIELGLNQDYLATFAAFINEQTALVTEATEPNSVVTVAETANIPVKSEIPVNEASETVELIPLSTPFIEHTDGTSSTGGGVVVFGTSLIEITNTSAGSAPDNAENFYKGFWTAEIANVHYYTVTLQSFVDLVNTINDKLLSLDNDKGKYDAFQQAIASVMYLPFDTTKFDGVTNLQYIPRYILPANYSRDADGTVKYHDPTSNTDYTVKCYYHGNTIQMAEPVNPNDYEALKIDSHGCVLPRNNVAITFFLVTFKLPHIFDGVGDYISAVVMPYNLDLDYFDVNNPLGTINKPERGLGPYVAKLDFEASIDDSHFLADTYPRALNLEPYTTLKAHLGPFGMIDIPLTKVYEPTENSTTAVYLAFTLCVDITTGDAILYVKASDGSVLAILQANIAQELALGSVSNNGVTHLSLISKALGIMAGAPVAGAMATNRLNVPVNESDSALQSAAAFDPSLKALAEMEAAAPLAAGGAIVGALAGGVGAALSVLTTSQDVQRKYTKFSGWLSESARAFYFEIKRIMPLFNDPDIIPDLYPIFKSMTLSSWVGHKIKAFLNKPAIPNSFAGLIPTKAELDVITKKLYSGVWLESNVTPPTPPTPGNTTEYGIGSGVTLVFHPFDSQQNDLTVVGPATAVIDNTVYEYAEANAPVVITNNLGMFTTYSANEHIMTTDYQETADVALATDIALVSVDNSLTIYKMNGNNIVKAYSNGVFALDPDAVYKVNSDYWLENTTSHTTPVRYDKYSTLNIDAGYDYRVAAPADYVTFRVTYFGQLLAHNAIPFYDCIIEAAVFIPTTQFVTGYTYSRAASDIYRFNNNGHTHSYLKFYDSQDNLLDTRELPGAMQESYDAGYFSTPANYVIIDYSFE